MRLNNQKQRRWDKAIRRRPQQNRMSHPENSKVPSPGKPRPGYRPAIVVSVFLAAVVIGIVLKFNTREQPSATTSPEHAAREDPEPVVPR